VVAAGPLAAALVAGCGGESGGLAPVERAARVAGVGDGDTIRLAGRGRVRLIGVDAPEVGRGGECFGRRASAFAARLAPAGARVRYRPGVEERDPYGRLLAYVWLPDGRMLNRVLVARGYARPLAIAPNDELADALARAAAAARRAGRGLWRACRAGG
jgi:micrococcal nuclease